MGTDESRSSSFRSSFWNLYNESTQCHLSWQSSSVRDKLLTGKRPSEDSFQRPDNVHCVNSFRAVCTELESSVSKQRTPASNLRQSSIHQRELAANVQTVSSDVRNKRSEAGDKAASAARSSKWLAFVNGITTELSSPGQLLLSVLIAVVNQSL